MIAGYRLVLAPRLAVAPRITALALAAGIAVGLLLAALTLIAIGLPPRALIDEFVLYAFAPSGGLATTLTRAIPLVLVGLSAAVALRIRFWNIGMEGQLWLGAVAATAVAITDIGPSFLRLPLMAVAAALAGAAWCLLPALAKVRLRAEEVITTLLLNYVAYLFVQQLLYGPWRNGETGFPVSDAFEPGVERLGLVGFGGLHWGLLLALAATAFAWAFCMVGRTGLLMRAVAVNPLAARAAGIHVGRTILLAAAVSGALAGLAGFCVVAGQEYKLTQFIGRDYVFPAIVIAYLGRTNPIGAAVAGIAMAGLYTAGDSLKAFYQIPLSIITTIQAVLLLSVAAFDFLPRYRLSLVHRTGEAG